MIIVSCGLARHLVVVVHDDHLQLSWWSGNQDYPYGPDDEDDRDNVMAVLKGSSEPLMVDPGQHVFFGHLRIRDTYSLLLLSDRDNQDDRDDHCHHFQ